MKEDICYATGAFVALEAIEKIPNSVRRVLLHTNAEKGVVDTIERACKQKGIAIEYANRVVERAGGKGNCFAVAEFERYEKNLDFGAAHLALVNPSNAGNLGTMLRTALAFDFLNVAIIRPAVDAFDTKTVRASMGSLFSLSVKYYETFEDYRKECGDERVFVPFMLDGEPLSSFAFDNRPTTLIFGNEGAGLAPSFHSVGRAALIEQSDAVDSLNVTVAAAVGMYCYKTFNK